MRRPVVAGNWKMNTTVDEALALVGAMKERLDAVGGVDKVVCPPFVSVAAVAHALRDTSIEVGAQNVYFESSGAYTGEISPAMLAPICQYVIIGHSERRRLFGETDEMVNRKLRAALDAGLKPILCVGEVLEQREAGQTSEVVTNQLRGALDGVASASDVVVAYEPVWAIGTGRAASSTQANATIAVIRQEISTLYGRRAGEEIRILYGGSVTAANIGEFVAEQEIDGALVGGASLDADEFVQIASVSSRLKLVP